jgi:acylphosphatase
MDVRVHILAKGVVQGVGFRYFVHKQALALGLNGWVCNLENGDVEIEAQGARSSVEEFIKAVKVGPRLAHVSDLLVRWKDPDDKVHRFEIV